MSEVANPILLGNQMLDGTPGLKSSPVTEGPISDTVFDDNSSRPARQQEFTLVVYHASGPCSYVLRGDAYAVGRDQGNAIQITNRFMSRRHAYLVRTPNPNRAGSTYCVIDGNRRGKLSTNGVYVNGGRVTSHYLQNGDVIHFGPEVKALFFEVVPIPSVPNPFLSDKLEDAVVQPERKIS
jgi:pSer/pThr/pTyr-binding forkhead associated (FHA) protein